ncbi:3-hydroxyacyl-CoA dehydrogenase NAD-binding domain-containing protein [Paracoccus sp. WLY502]|uniref:3-hydroxyacyl-CoA dehydrogenase NAD-binding domain-containing protein n=1 Tax=Paracoccus yibinensis TaxID=3068891 RepID=UPI0027969F51|nr:3-hydroxyacyl-CoA dehydrogenase NAD-binding domain-containing protein [Paracoccus sp. WLY502]MDQ1901848.1 3-hydroxyacyl-CoA dehydrogenase NAD-binding domain-containing protein [Paracoccus sp. WLY502]
MEAGDRIAVIGGGLIGTSWAALFLAWGHDVTLFEPDEASRRAIPQAVAGPIGQIAELASGLPAPGRLHLAASLDEAVRDAAWVQENVPEKVPLKRAIYAAIEAAAPGGITIASSTSSLVWSELSAEMADPSRLITAHPFNPPHLMPLVELYGPDAGRVQAAAAFYRSLDRHPVFLRREAVGHIANRLSSALWREAVNMVAEGIADVDQIDAALVHGPGLRWSVVGAHMAYHLGGGAGGIGHYLSHLGPSQERRWQDLGQPRLDAANCARLVEGIAAEAGGRDIATLEALRDAGLIAVQRALKDKRP